MNNDLDKTWSMITDEIKSQISMGNFQAFFKGAQIESLNETTVVLSLASAFHVQNIKSRFLPLLETTIEQVIGRKVTVDFVVNSQMLQKKTTSSSTDEEMFQPQQVEASQAVLNPKYTLENFVVGLTNNVAYAAAKAVAENPGLSYNPLFLYGGTGVGKTHLMLGVGNAILKKNPQSKVIFCSSEKFMNDYVGAIQEHKMGRLRSKYRSVDVLLIDDIQFFSGREGTQEEFFHTFNELQGRNAQMILTSDRSPHEIAKLEDRLKSRFAGGLMIDIQPPDFDTRVAILKAKSQEWGSFLPEDSLKLIASSTQSNIRELEGKLMQVVQILRAQNLELSPANISTYLNGNVQKPLSITHKEVLSIICSYFNLSAKDLTGPKRQKELVLPRHLTMYILSEDLGMTVEKIGQILGGRDHTTVMHGRDRIKKSLLENTETQRLLTEIKNSLSASN